MCFSVCRLYNSFAVFSDCIYFSVYRLYKYLFWIWPGDWHVTWTTELSESVALKKSNNILQLSNNLKCKCKNNAVMIKSYYITIIKNDVQQHYNSRVDTL